MKRPEPVRAALLSGLLSLLLLPSPAFSQDQTSLTSALDSLLSIPVSTAAKYAQTSREAAASVTVITSDEIRRQGFRTIADALRTVTGFYFTDDLTHQSIGVRGFGSFGGDNKTVLVLLDGHALNDNFYDGARLGTAQAIDLGAIDRIEVVRGPGSALYGSNAMLGVVNLVTRGAASIDGVEVGAEAGSDGLRRGSLVAGHVTGSGLELTLAGTWSEADGHDVYFPEWDNPVTNGGVAADLDWHDNLGVHGSVTQGPWRLVGYYTTRETGIPTAPFGSTFGDPAARAADERFFGELSLDADLGVDKNVLVRAYTDGAQYDVTWPYLPGNLEGGSRGRWFGMESRLRWDRHPAQRFTVGTEARRNHTAEIFGQLPLIGPVMGNFRSTVLAGFAQADLRLHERLDLTLGARLDHYSSVGTAFSPRGALVFHAAAGTTLKALYGEAFRAPNQPELNVEAPPIIERNPDIRPERIRTIELVWEQRLSRSVHAKLSAFDYRLSRLITTESGTMAALRFANRDRGRANGLEAELDVRLDDHFSARTGYAFLNPIEGEEQFNNTPEHMVSASVMSSAVPYADVALTALFDGGRLGGMVRSKSDSYLLLNASLSTGTLGPVRLSAVVENVFDAEYVHPASQENLQAFNPQAGRRLRFRVDLAF